jgi:DnaJ-class molecular chaperone
MVAGIEHMTARENTVSSRYDDVSLRQASGQGSQNSDCAEVSCAFCHGKGTHPYGILSWLPTCCVCKGSGIMHVQAPQESCAHSQDTGAL